MVGEGKFGEKRFPGILAFFFFHFKFAGGGALVDCFRFFLHGGKDFSIFFVLEVFF